MAKRALGPATLAIVQAVRARCDPERPWLVACSGGRDSLALAAAAGLAGPDRVTALVVDHGLQAGSADVAE
ncbi:MAG TPA: tRNA lysidine(34) synthetase TilS, partial [Bacillota bacterium]|nr:tRNA lysidine(34) synthetase TilS [Bacillota bacterium]